MDTRELLEEAIRRPVRSSDDAEAVGEAANLLAELLRVEARVRDLVGEDASASTPRTDLRGVALHEAAELVLDEAGVPLHVRDLGARIKARGWRHPRSSHARPQLIQFQLAARLPRYPDRFRRVAPNTFGLAKWEHQAPAPKGRRPRTALFRGPGSGVARQIGDSAEQVTSESASWRSS